MIPQSLEEYNQMMGFNSVDIGSVATLRKEVNKKLTEKGYQKLKGYKPKTQLRAIYNSLIQKDARNFSTN